MGVGIKTEANLEGRLRDFMREGSPRTAPERREVKGSRKQLPAIGTPCFGSFFLLIWSISPSRRLDRSLLKLP